MEYMGIGVIVALFAIIAQTGAMFYWGGQIKAMMVQHDKDITDHEERLRSLEHLDIRDSKFEFTR